MSKREGVPSLPRDRGYELGELDVAARPARPADPAQPAGDDEPSELVPLALAPRSLPENDRVIAIGVPLSAAFDDAVDADPLELDLPSEGPVALRSSKPPRRASSPRPSTPLPPAEESAEAAPRASVGPRDDEREARELARFGPPERGLGSARYALLVARRLFALWFERRALEQQASELAVAYDDALLALGRALLEDGAVTQHEGLRDRVALVHARQAELVKLEGGARAAREDHAREHEAAQAERSALEAKLEPALDAERRALRDEQRAAVELKRLKAQLQRAEIELRALAKASTPPPGERVTQIREERAERLAQQEALLAQHAAASAALGRARREVALRRGATEAFEQLSAGQRSQASEHVAAWGKRLALAEHALSSALCGLAEEADKYGLAHAAAEHASTLRRREAALDAAVARVARYDRALTLYDRASLLRGMALWALLLVAALLLLTR